MSIELTMQGTYEVRAGYPYGPETGTVILVTPRADEAVQLAEQKLLEWDRGAE